MAGARRRSLNGDMLHEKPVGDKKQMAIEREYGGGDGGAKGGGDSPEEQVWVITLNDGEHQDSTLYRFDRGSRLQFAPGPSLLGRTVVLYVNYPVDNPEEATFVRNQYYQVQWRGEGSAEGSESGALITRTDLCCELTLRRAGTFHYYFVYEDAAAGPMGSGWWQTPPSLPLGLSLDALSVQTVLTRCLGPLARWGAALRPAREAGYTAVHFTPVQALGESGSAYSLADQLRLDPALDASVGDLEQFLSMMRHEWKMLSIGDVVLNHTASNSAWLAEHPEAAYNCGACPRLRPAALLDATLAALSDDVSKDALQHLGVPAALNNEEHLNALRGIISSRVSALRLHEMYQADTAKALHAFTQHQRRRLPPAAAAAEDAPAAGAEQAGEQLQLQQDPQHRRLACTLDMDLALRLYDVYLPDCYDEETRLRRCAANLQQRLDTLNQRARDRVDEHLRAAVDNCIAGIRYWRVQSDGPRLSAVTVADPLLPRYFTWPAGASTAGLEQTIWGDAGRLVMAHNGWVMRGDPLHDFAAEGDVYLRRELIAWGDSVKLRYGSCPEDNPFLWSHMRAYVEQSAELFDGLRLDNCHSTPLHVAEYLLDAARNIKPDLYLLAELFTDSPLVDNIFVNRLGITSLVREAQSAWDARELGRQLHRFGSRAVGSFMNRPLQPRRAVARLPHALLYDLTHDNPSAIERRSAHDLLPTAALVAAAAAAGSTRGYDELVPHHIHVVEERRLYRAWGGATGPAGSTDQLTGAEGIQPARRLLHRLHAELARGGYTEIFVDQMDDHVIAVTRHCPSTRESIIVVAHTAFRPPCEADMCRRPPPLRFEGVVRSVPLEAWLRERPAPPYRAHERLITGLPQYECVARADISLADSQCLGEAREDGKHTEISWGAFPPGAVVALRVAPHAGAAAAVQLAARVPPLAPLLAPLAPLDLNVLLYRCAAEEADAGGGVYDVPGHGPLPFAGLAGVAVLLEDIAHRDDLAHPLCRHLRDGDWLLDYIWRRLDKYPSLAPVRDYYRDRMQPLKELPRYLIPAYFEQVISAAYTDLQAASIARMSSFVQRGGRLVKALALTAVQLRGSVLSAQLPRASPALGPPPYSRATLAAGLPHFAAGYMRSWGRDTFIALRGLLLLTGQAGAARDHILGYAACLRHGLLPNLLDGGERARYNCRDAVWWWLYAIQSYCSLVEGGERILHEPVSRLYPTDDAPPAAPGHCDQPLHQVMQEALDTHFQGLVYRERRAGKEIDAHMTDQGFNVQIGIDPHTGFVFGGNQHNCGTWMDKMGSSEQAGTRGRPATPRDGSAVELVALSHSTARWLQREHAAGRYPHAGLTRKDAHAGSALAWSWRDWAERIEKHFERCFWVGPPGGYEDRPDLVHRRNIYKDSYGASQPWADYQLRCNYAVALSVSPSLCAPAHGWTALQTARELLAGPLGAKTLDPADWAYRPDYDNDDHSGDPATAHGYNYHQGPEWVWPLPHLLRARLLLAPAEQRVRVRADTRRALGRAQHALQQSAWRALPELTNADGKHCPHSCDSQAWSNAAFLELLYELEQQERAVPLAASD